MPTNVTYMLHDVNEESQGIYAVEMVPTGTGLETGTEVREKDEVAIVILRKYSHKIRYYYILPSLHSN